LFIVACLLLALIPASALASGIQPPQSKISSDSNALQEVMGSDAGVTGRIEDIYWKDWEYYGIWRELEGVVLPSAIGTVDIMVSWFNDSTIQVTGHLEATVTKPLGGTLSLPVTGGQDTNLAPGESMAVLFDMIIDQSGPWVLHATLSDETTSSILDQLSVNFEVAGISPAFEGFPRVCDTPPCSVTFTNLVSGGATPYQNAVWNFGDGTTPIEGVAKNSGETLTHTYTVPGVFDVTLQIWDAEGTTASVIEVDYITVDESTNIHTWHFSTSGFFPKHLLDAYTGQVVLTNLADVPPELQGVYWWDDDTLEWKFWAPGAPGTTLATLGGGHSYDYMVSVSGHCAWDIPLP
jgi:PKD repeat protein